MPRKRENPIITPEDFIKKFAHSELLVPSDHRFDAGTHAVVETEYLASVKYGTIEMFQLFLDDGKVYVQEIYKKYLIQTKQKIWQFNSFMKAWGAPIVKFSSVIGPYWSDIPSAKELVNVNNISEYLFYGDREIAITIEPKEGELDEEE